MVESDPVVDRIEAILPQTQCGQCNYPGCRPYAEAIASGGHADINQCPHRVGRHRDHGAGGPAGNVEIKALNPENGEIKTQGGSCHR